MKTYRNPAVTYVAAQHKGCLFWITCKWLKLLRKADCLQLIQKSVPSLAGPHQCCIRIQRLQQKGQMSRYIPKCVGIIWGRVLYEEIQYLDWLTQGRSGLGWEIKGDRKTLERVVYSCCIYFTTTYVLLRSFPFPTHIKRLHRKVFFGDEFW